MQSTITPQETDPHDTFLIEPDVVLAARTDHALPDPVQDALSRLAQRAAHTTPSVSATSPVSVASPVSAGSPSVSAGAPSPPVDTTFRAAAIDATKVFRAAAVDTTMVPPKRSTSGGGRAKKTVVAFMFALCSAVAAATWSDS